MFVYNKSKQKQNCGSTKKEKKVQEAEEKGVIIYFLTLESPSNMPCLCLVLNIMRRGHISNSGWTNGKPSWASGQRLRVIGQSGKRWYDDPNPKTLLTLDKAWVYGNCPLVRLQWDPGDYVWQMNSLSSSHAQHRSFFDYSVKYGRNLLVEARICDPAASKVWDDYGIPQDIRKDFWKRLWNQIYPRKITTFCWLLIHRSLPVGAWYKGRVEEQKCLSCGNSLETQQHCLWECEHAQAIWKRVLRLMARSGMKGVISWGTAAWALLESKVTTYESNPDSKAFFIQRGYIHRSFLLPFAGQESEGERNPQWELLCGITLWVIWKSRCIRVFSGKKVPPVEGIKEIWAEAVHSLKGQYDSI